MRLRLLARLILVLFFSLIACAAFLILPAAPPAASAAAAATPTPQPTVESRQACIAIEDHLPADLRPGGGLLLHGDTWSNHWNNTMYHLDLMSRRASPYQATSYTDYTALSPDGKWLAFLDISFGEKSNQKSRVLQVTNAEGRRLDMSYWLLDWQYLIGWQDNKHLILAVPGYPGGDYIILNPFTRQKEVIPIHIPGVRTKDYWNYPDNVFPNAALSHWVTFNEVDARWRLFARDGWQLLWYGGDYYNQPTWSPNGRYFITNLVKDSAASKLVRVGLDGVVVPITNIIGEETRLSWSPDGRSLAGWVQIHPISKEDPNHLVLIDVEKPLLTDLCFENQKEDSEYNDIYNYSPVWSPDGRFLAIAVSRYVKVEHRYSPTYTATWTETYRDTAIIDLQTHRAYKLVENAIPQAWMKKAK